MRSSIRCRTLIMLGIMATPIALSGCASSATSAKSEMALMCPKCETVWVRKPHWTAGFRDRVYISKSEMTCPTCDKMAKSYFEDGKSVLHNCPDCKVTPRKINALPEHLRIGGNR